MIQHMPRSTWNVGRWMLALVLAVTTAAPLAAQQRPVAPSGEQRRPMEQLAAMVKQRLGLTDDQALKLRQSTRRFALERQGIVAGERAARRELRAQIESRASADQQRVGVLLDTLLLLQRRRVDVLAAEQRELATFLSPVQRAEFLALQERAFRAAQQVRMRRESGARGERALPPRRDGWRGDTAGRP